MIEIFRVHKWSPAWSNTAIWLGCFSSSESTCPPRQITALPFPLCKLTARSGGWAESTEAETFGSICLEVEAIGSVMSRDANVAELSMSIGSEEGGTTGSEKRQGVYFF